MALAALTEVNMPELKDPQESVLQVTGVKMYLGVFVMLAFFILTSIRAV